MYHQPHSYHHHSYHHKSAPLVSLILVPLQKSSKNTQTIRLTSSGYRTTWREQWSWLATLPIDEHGGDAHYGWRLSNLPSHCICGHHQFTVQSATTNWGTLQRVSSLRFATTMELNHHSNLSQENNSDLEQPANRACLDIAADNFWGRGVFRQSHRHTVNATRRTERTREEKSIRWRRFSTSGGMVYKRIASMTAQKQNKTRHTVR